MADLTADAAIAVRGLTYRYRQNTPRPVLKDIDLEINRSDYLLVTGRSGSGKSTLCRTLNGLIPHFYGGVISGDVWVAGQPVSETSVAMLFDQVGMAFQNPDAQLFCRSVEQEIVFGLESLGLSRETIEERLNTVLTQVGIDHLRGRDPQTLSGGEKHLVLIGALLALRPKLIVLDEPFANLDPTNVLIVRRLLRQLHASGLGVVLCEHRLSRAVPDATRLVVIHKGQIAADGDPQSILARPEPEWGLEAPLATRAGAALNMTPLPSRIEDLEKMALPPDLVGQLEDPLPEIMTDQSRPPALEVDHLSCQLGAKRILNDISFRLYPGECIALVGANGAGKTTLLRHLIGLQRPTKGSIRIDGRDNRPYPVSELARDVGLAFQNPDNQFFRFTVDEEIRVGPEALDRYEPSWVKELLHLFQLERYKSQAPYRLSGGEKKRVAFASALAARPKVLALDEPTAGQDFAFRRSLRAFLKQMLSRGQAIIIVTHDLTFAERMAGRWLLMAEGHLLADDSPDHIMADADLMRNAGLEPTDRFRLSRLWQSGGPHA